jgi:hypothetical protein
MVWDLFATAIYTIHDGVCIEVVETLGSLVQSHVSGPYILIYIVSHHFEATPTSLISHGVA